MTIIMSQMWHNSSIISRSYAHKIQHWKNCTKRYYMRITKSVHNVHGRRERVGALSYSTSPRKFSILLRNIKSQKIMFSCQNDTKARQILTSTYSHTGNFKTFPPFQWQKFYKQMDNEEKWTQRIWINYVYSKYLHISWIRIKNHECSV